jgi:hypothetical protein
MTTHEMARRLGSRGGRARAQRLSADERRRIAASGGHARRRSIEAAQRIIDNFNYLAMVMELRGGPHVVTAMKTFKGPLPGIYASRRRRAPAQPRLPSAAGIGAAPNR